MAIKRPNQVYLSVVIPVYNETVRLKSGLRSVLSFLKRQPYTWEVILIDDGSDNPLLTHLKAKDLKRVISLRLPHNMGKGRAIREGVVAAHGKYIVFSDIDLSVPISEVQTMLRLLKTKKLVIASRRLSHSAIIVHQPWLRESAGRLFTELSNMMCTTQVADVTCGFKGFTRQTANILFPRLRINRWVFDTELIYLARKFKIPVYEMPVGWSNKSGSKVRPLDGIGSFIDLFRIRLNDLCGVYNRPINKVTN
ncbi:MAG TPA: glycosyltransferase [Patescibacteria group bacterium]|nr:glycosyltransferase [Patescibacteria group bacterium]